MKLAHSACSGAGAIAGCLKYERDIWSYALTQKSMYADKYMYSAQSLHDAELLLVVSTS